jgi:hypothetical protein
VQACRSSITSDAQQGRCDASTAVADSAQGLVWLCGASAVCMPGCNLCATACNMSCLRYMLNYTSRAHGQSALLCCWTPHGVLRSGACPTSTPWHAGCSAIHWDQSVKRIRSCSCSHPGCLEQVKRDHHELFKQYAPIWAKEEVERASLWTTFLLSFAPDASRYPSLPNQLSDAADVHVKYSTDDLRWKVLSLNAQSRELCRVDASAADQLDAACAAGLEPFNAALNGWRAAQASGEDVEMPEWLPQLRCLVQAGVPRVRVLTMFLPGDTGRECVLQSVTLHAMEPILVSCAMVPDSSTCRGAAAAPGQAVAGVPVPGGQAGGGAVRPAGSESAWQH